MSNANRGTQQFPLVNEAGNIVELTILIPGCALEVLEAVARREGVTTGQLLRQLIRHFLHEALASQARAAEENLP